MLLAPVKYYLYHLCLWWIKALLEIGAVGPRPSLPQPPFTLCPGMMAAAETLFAVGNLAAVRM